ESLSQSHQLDIGAAGACGGIDSHQGAEPSAIDVGHPAQVEDEVLGLVEEFLQGAAQGIGFVAEDYLSRAVHDGDTVRRAGFHLERHYASVPNRENSLRSLARCAGRWQASESGGISKWQWPIGRRVASIGNWQLEIGNRKS